MLLLLLLTFIFYLNFVSRVILAPLLPEIETRLIISHGQAGTLFLCLSVGYFVSLISSGFITARLGQKQTISLSMLASGVSLGVISASSTLLFLQVGYLLLGLGTGAYLPAAVTTITELYQPNRLGRAFGIHEIAPNLAFLSAPLFAAWLLPVMHWQQIFQILAGAAVCAAIIYSLVGQETRFRGSPPDIATCRELLSRKDFQLMVILFGMGISATHGVFSVLPMFLVTVHGMEEQAANMLVGLSRSTTLVTAFLGGWLADRFGSHKTMAMVLLLTGLFTILLGCSSGNLLMIWIWLQPLVAVCFFAPAFSVISQIGSSKARTIAVSLAIPAAFVLGGGIIPALITRLADMDQFSLGMVLNGVFIATGGLLFRVMTTTSPSPEKTKL